MSGAWSPYMAWMKDPPPAAFDLRGSNLLHCEVGDLPGAREALALDGPHEDGYEPLKEAIGDRYGLPSNSVAVATGTSGANFLVCGALVRPGDHVVVERPTYDPLLAIPRFLGAEVTRFERRYEDGFAVDPDRVARALTSRTRLVIITNLHNPTGALTTPDVLEAVRVAASRVGAKVLVDEVYLDSVPGLDQAPAAVLSPGLLSTASLTKAYGLSGLRAGWVLAEPEIVELIKRVRDIVDAVGPFPTEVLAHLAFKRLSILRDRARGILEPNLARISALVESRSELEWIPPAGGSVGFPRVRGMHDTREFVERLRSRYDTGVVPGYFFEAPQHFRVALGGRTEVLEEGLARLGRALDEMKGHQGPANS